LSGSGCTNSPGNCKLDEFCDNRYPSGLCTWDAKLYSYEETASTAEPEANDLALEQKRRDVIERSALHKVCSFLHPPTSRPWEAAPHALRRLFGRPSIDWQLVEAYANGQNWSGQEQLDSLDPYTGCILELLVVLNRQPDLLERLIRGTQRFSHSN
jgi:hypothetical protein